MAFAAGVLAATPAVEVRPEPARDPWWLRTTLHIRSTVVRAAMGAHFGLRLVEGLEEDELAQLTVPLVATSSHGGVDLAGAPLPRPCAWVLGHEGQGVADSLLARCALRVRIPQPGGEESLNVAAAAAVCLYESARRV
jgi:TrmH family RNA methyltransferase